MLQLNFTISNPFSKRFKNIKCWSGATPFKNKFWEFQILATSDLICIHFSYTIRQDHAGLRLELGLFGYSIDFNIYDNRHWDYIGEKWEVYNDEKGIL
jgi:hypothetical protein